MDNGEYTDSLVNLRIDISPAYQRYFNYDISLEEDDFLAVAQREDYSYYLTINSTGEITEHEGSYEPIGTPADL